MEGSNQPYKCEVCGLEIAKEALHICQPRYECPIHGEIDNLTFDSTIAGLDGHWCLKCYVEWVDKNVTRVKLIPKVN